MNTGKIYKVKDIVGEEALKKRLKALGIIRDSKIKIYKYAPFGDPVIIQVNELIQLHLEKSFFKILY